MEPLGPALGARTTGDADIDLGTIDQHVAALKEQVIVAWLGRRWDRRRDPLKALGGESSKDRPKPEHLSTAARNPQRQLDHPLANHQDRVARIELSPLLVRRQVLGLGRPQHPGTVDGNTVLYERAGEPVDFVPHSLCGIGVYLGQAPSAVLSNERLPLGRQPPQIRRPAHHDKPVPRRDPHDRLPQPAPLVINPAVSHRAILISSAPILSNRRRKSQAEWQWHNEADDH